MINVFISMEVPVSYINPYEGNYLYRLGNDFYGMISEYSFGNSYLYSSPRGILGGTFRSLCSLDLEGPMCQRGVSHHIHRSPST